MRDYLKVDRIIYSNDASTSVIAEALRDLRVQSYLAFLRALRASVVKQVFKPTP